MNKNFRVAIFASGSGSNAEQIVRYFQNHPSISVVLILTNNPAAYVLERAKNLNVPSKTFDKAEYLSPAVLEWLKEYQVTHVVLAGFLWLVPSALLHAYPDRIINIHPALLPKFGGKGMYGMKIHELVRELNETETGITIHLVNDKFDEGKIIDQRKCNVSPDDSPEEIALKVHQLEYAWYPRVIEQWILGDNFQ
jgi:phosphoribosylglycinamide formyltransferase-1